MHIMQKQLALPYFVHFNFVGFCASAHIFFCSPFQGKGGVFLLLFYLTITPSCVLKMWAGGLKVWLFVCFCFCFCGLVLVVFLISCVVNLHEEKKKDSSAVYIHKK